MKKMLVPNPLPVSNHLKRLPDNILLHLQAFLTRRPWSPLCNERNYRGEYIVDKMYVTELQREWSLEDQYWRNFMNSSKDFSILKKKTIYLFLNSIFARDYCSNSEFFVYVNCNVVVNPQLQIGVKYFPCSQPEPEFKGNIHALCLSEFRPREASFFQNISYLSLTFDLQSMSILSDLPNLRNLCLNRIRSSTILQNLPNLCRLAIIDCPAIFDLSRVHNLQPLQEISLLVTNISRGWEIIQNVPSVNLEGISKDRNYSFDYSYLQFASSLEFHSCDISNIESFTHVQSLTILDCPMIIDQYASLSKLSNLRYLELFLFGEEIVELNGFPNELENCLLSVRNRSLTILLKNCRMKALTISGFGSVTRLLIDELTRVGGCLTLAEKSYLLSDGRPPGYEKSYKGAEPSHDVPERLQPRLQIDGQVGRYLAIS
jgi:hypothetical protein